MFLFIMFYLVSTFICFIIKVIGISLEENKDPLNIHPKRFFESDFNSGMYDPPFIFILFPIFNIFTAMVGLIGIVLLLKEKT